MLKKLSDHVYYMPHYSETDRPALGLVCGENFSVIVDAGNSPAHARDFMNEIEKMDVAPVKFVLLTHWHWDHVFGMKTMGLFTISQEKTKKQLEKMKTLQWDDASLDARVETGEEIEFCRDMIKREMPVRDELELIIPDMTFHDRIEIDLGGITCVMEHVGGEHAEDSSIIHIPEERVMFLGDCIYQDFYSGEWSYDRNKLSTLLNKVVKYEADHYVTGHQAPKTNEEMGRFLDDLVSIGEIVGEEVVVDQAVAQFNDIRNANPTDDQLEFIQNFVYGNRKKRAE
ncbi:MBL fold metallo-hydrolase [Virgibacillus xinjiangensis]|uniref:MBL fold metallo-hydrolase n=1 Tax=Virgibacillus xinjiangensis TaxID=393090 RepID=A0ABV7CX49_9BACI